MLTSATSNNTRTKNTFNNMQYKHSQKRLMSFLTVATSMILNDLGFKNSEFLGFQAATHCANVN